MANGYTVYFSYLLASDSGNTNGCGYSDAIHCNYINSVYLDTVANKDVNIYFNSADEFRFLSSSGGSGFTANKIYILVQLIDNTKYSTLDEVKPNSAEWKVFDATNQVSGYTTGNTFCLTRTSITTTVFKVPLYQYNQMSSYDLSYLNYPTSLTSDSNKLCFGDEEFFFGNVYSDVEAIAYSTDLSIQLPLNEFNSTTNATWDNVSEVYITEIGIYDNDKNLIAVGKLNNPLPKDATISRTIVFGIDF